MTRLFLPSMRGYSPAPSAVPSGPYDWNGILIMGQSLSVGETASPPISTSQPYSNLKLVDSGYNSGGPLSVVTQGTLSMQPLTEFLRDPASNATYPYEYKRNIEGETPASGLCNQLAASLGWICVASNFGVTAEGIAGIKKGGTTNAYAAMLYEVGAIAGLAAGQGKTYGVVAVLLVHGELDGFLGTADYTAQIAQLHADIRADLPSLTGQAGDIRMIISQQTTAPTSLGRPISSLTPLELRDSSPDLVLATVKHQYPYRTTDKLHMGGPAYRRIGEDAAKALVRHRRGEAPTLRPTGAELSGSTITVSFEVPWAPLQWSTTVPACHPGTVEWANGRGFEVETAGGVKVTISSASIVGSTVVITCATPPGAGARLSYAMYQDATGYHGGEAAGRHGELCDSDPFESYSAATISCSVESGSDVIECVNTGAFAARGEREIVTGSGLSGIVHVTEIDGDLITLSAPWAGATGTAALRFRNDHRNYAPGFSLVL